MITFITSKVLDRHFTLKSKNLSKTRNTIFSFSVYYYYNYYYILLFYFDLQYNKYTRCFQRFERNVKKAVNPYKPNAFLWVNWYTSDDTECGVSVIMVSIDCLQIIFLKLPPNSPLIQNWFVRLIKVGHFIWY